MSEPARSIDPLGRPSVTDAMKAQITQAFTVVPPYKRAALLFIADTETGAVRAHVAARIGDTWKVAAGAGVSVPAKRPHGFIGIEAAW